MVQQTGHEQRPQFTGGDSDENVRPAYELGGDHYEQRVIQAAKRTTESYYSMVSGLERQDFVGHNERVAIYIRAFIGEEIPPEVRAAVLAAAHLHDLPDRAVNTHSPRYNVERAEAAKIAQLNFFSDPNLDEKTANYILSLLADTMRVEGMAGQYRKSSVDEATVGARRLSPELKKMVKSRYKGEIPPEVWGVVEPMMDPEHLEGAIRAVDPYAIYIGACEILDNITRPSSERDSAILQDVLEAESFYIPLCEILGYEALAAKLVGRCKKVRLEKQGKTEFINKARAILDDVTDLDTTKLVSSALGMSDINTLPVIGEYQYSIEDTDRATEERPSIMGEVIPQSKGATRIKYRIKSEGSLADSIKRGQEQGRDSLPMDVLGVTVISRDQRQSAVNFAEFIANNLLQAEVDDRTLQAAPSKQRAIYVQGSFEYVNMVLAELDARGIPRDAYDFKFQDDATRDKYDVDILEVAKATYLTSQHNEGREIKVPTEVQFITQDERERMRIGDIAHIIYKYLSQISCTRREEYRIRKRFIALMRHIYAHKKRAGHGLDVNPSSVPYAEDYAHKLTS